MLQFLFICLGIMNSARADFFPSEAQRGKIFDKFVQELERIDGEGLPPRKNRPESWGATMSKLREEISSAESPQQFGQVFRKLDATYTNLHAQVVLDEKFDIAAGGFRPRIGVRFGPEVVKAGQKKFSYKINSIETDLMNGFTESRRPAIGDEVLAINGRPTSQWALENFIYCKFPMREQCEADFFNHFRKGFSSWRWNQPLEYTLRRHGRTWSINVPIDMTKVKGQFSSAVKPNDGDGCPVEADRYEGFKTVYRGWNICAFKSESNSGVVVLRIASFRYRQLPKDSKIQSLKDEVSYFYDEFWKAEAPQTKKLIIDVIDNGGGDSPIAWYQIFFDKPFQEQFVQFKKTPEIEADSIRKDLFYEEGAKEIWFQEIKKSGLFESVKTGRFLPQIPQFCALEDKSCPSGLFEPRSHGFKGEVRLLVNEWCVSSCTGFVWSVKDQLKGRVKVAGFPDSGDSAYARLFIDLYFDSASPEGFRLEISPRPGQTNQKLPDGAILRQQVTATRSTDSKGRILSATPTKVDFWIPYEYRHYDDTWEAKAFKAALKN